MQLSLQKVQCELLNSSLIGSASSQNVVTPHLQQGNLTEGTACDCQLPEFDYIE